MKIIDYLLSPDPELSELGKALILDKLDLNEFYASFFHFDKCSSLSFFEAWIKFITCKICTWDELNIIGNTYRKDSLLHCDSAYFLITLKNCLSQDND